MTLLRKSKYTVDRPLFSIIIPAYNAELAIMSTLSSIPYVKDNSIEIIIVDDGSTDHTAKSALQYSKESGKKIRIITTKNQGPAHARNTGIHTAKGKFTLFLDADDTLDVSIFDIIRKELEKNKDIDLILFGFRIVNASGETLNTYSHPSLSLNADALGSHFSELYQSNLLNQVWNKVYRTSLIKSLQFQDLKYGEDRIFVLDYLRQVRSIFLCEDVLYNYHITSAESLISKFYDKKLDVTLLIDKRIRIFSTEINAIDPVDIKIYDYMLLKGIVSCMTNIFAMSCPYTKRERLRSIRDIIGNKRVRELSSRWVGGTTYLKAIVRVIGTENVVLNYYLAKGIHTINTIAPRLFTRLKHNKKK